MSKKTGLIFGIDGQDGSYLAELLLSQGYQVIGWIPSGIAVSVDNIAHLRDQITIIEGSLSDQEEIEKIIQEYRPQEVYNLASPSSPSASWKSPIMVGDVTALGVMRILEAIRTTKPEARFYQASSSEMFGNPVEVPQNERTPFHPRNPYGIAKLYAHWATVNYRQQHGLFSVSGILYNHESPRRGLHFVTRKITRSAAMIKVGLANELRLGNLEARRDWGYAGDYVRAIWLMLQQETPEDYVVGTGETHSVRQFCQAAFEYLDLDYHQYVQVDPRYYRPVESGQLVADSRKVNQELNWRPEVSFSELVQKMVDADLEQIST